MDNSCPSSTTESAVTTTSSATSSASGGGGGGGGSSSTNRDNYLKHLNKLSHKISKPTNNHNVFLKKPDFENTTPPPPPIPLPPPQQQQQQQQQQHQPPVYNINKNDFRDVVQKLTGSPAHHDRFSNPTPPLQPPKPQISSRLQRIRPPPLAQLSNRPPSSLECAAPPNNNNNPIIPPMGSVAAHFNSIGRSTTPLSPLPPFPTVHAAAESPVSAYMRYLHNSISAVDSNQKQQSFSGFSPLPPRISPRWTNLTPQQQNQQAVPPQQGMVSSASPQPQFAMPPSPLPFGCLNSPLSQYPLLSPNQLGFPQLPLSPTVPLPSPRWRGL